MNSVGLLASGIWEDLGSPSSPSVTYISGWIGSDRGIGKLNTLLNTEFIIDKSGAYEGSFFDAGGYSGIYQAGDFYPAFGNTEAAIYAEVYKQDYYTTKIRDTLNGIFDDTNGIEWVSLSEGDSSIRRVNKSEVAKTYNDLLKESKKDVRQLVGLYRSNLSSPYQISTQEPLNNHVYVTWGNQRG